MVEYPIAKIKQEKGDSECAVAVVEREATRNNVANVIVRFLSLVKSGLPNFVFFPFVSVL